MELTEISFLLHPESLRGSSGLFIERRNITEFKRHEIKVSIFNLNLECVESSPRLSLV